MLANIMEKISRNAKCPCGSGRKYKKCCMGEDSPHAASSGPPKRLSAKMPVTQSRKSKSLTIQDLFELAPEQARSLNPKIFDLLEKEIKGVGFDLEDVFDFDLIEAPFGFIFTAAPNIEIDFDFDFESDEDYELFDDECSVGINRSGELLLKKGSSTNSSRAIALLYSGLSAGKKNGFEPGSTFAALAAIFRWGPLAEAVNYFGVGLVHDHHVDFDQFQGQKIKLSSDDYDFFGVDWMGQILSHAESTKAFRLKKYDSLLVLFSDGFCISFCSLLRHPYRLFCQPKIQRLLQIIENQVDNPDFVKCSWYQRSTSRYEYIRPQSLLSIAKGLLKAQEPLFLTFCSDDQIKIDPSYRIADIAMQKETLEATVCVQKPSKASQLSYDIEIRVDHVSDQGQSVEFSGFKWDPIEKTLLISEGRSGAEIVFSELRKRGLYGRLKSKVIELFACPHLGVVEEVLNQTCAQLNNCLPDQLEKISASLITSYQDVTRKSVEWSVMAQIDGKEVSIIDGDESLRRIDVSLHRGLAAFFDSDGPAAATSTKKLRPAELKLYRHTGLIRLLLLEILRETQVIDEQKRARSKFKVSTDFEAQISSFIHQVLFKEMPSEDLSFKDIAGQLVSAKFLTRLKEFIVATINLIEKEFYFATSDRRYLIELSSVYRSLLNDLVMCHLTGMNSKEAFLKSKASLIKTQTTEFTGVLLPESERLKPLHTLTAEEQLPLPERPDGIILIDGKRIERLSTDDLKTEIQVKESDSIDWFELHPKYFFRGREISSTHAQAALKGELIFFRGQYYQVDPQMIPSFRSLEKFWARLRASGSARQFYANSERQTAQIRGERSQVLELLALKRQGVSVEGGPRWQEISKRFDLIDVSTGMDQSEFKKSVKDFAGELKSFQLEGFNRLVTLYHLGLGSILADDMGLGKTVQTCAFLQFLDQQQVKKPRLIVVPSSLIYNWDSELKRFCPTLSVEIFDGLKKESISDELSSIDSPILITTYGLLIEHPEFFLEHTWACTIFDEAQTVKNIQSKRRQVAAQLKSDFKLALTGTPLENHFGEFFSILDLCVPGALGSYQEFMKIYGNKAPATGENAFVIEREDVQFLKEKVKPLVLRRTKEAVLNDLPEKTESVVNLEFDEKQRALYKKIAASHSEQVNDLIRSKGVDGAQLAMLTALLRLRQVCSLPNSVPGTKGFIHSPKLELLEEKLSELVEKNQSCIVFTNFVSTLEELQSRLQKIGIRSLSICGRDSRVSRRKTLEAFDQSSEASVLIMTLKTGGIGLNLTKASYVFHVEPWWNPAAEAQGTDRVHRMGQKRSVQVYRYIMKYSIEENIQKLKTRKKQAFDCLFAENVDALDEGVGLGNARLTQDDFATLLS